MIVVAAEFAAERCSLFARSFANRIAVGSVSRIALTSVLIVIPYIVGDAIVVQLMIYRPIV